MSKRSVKCPVREIAWVLREVQRVDAFGLPKDVDSIDVRLQILETGDWAVHTGDASYDTDHHGVWGAGEVPVRGRFDSMGLAKALWNQAVDMAVDEASDFPELCYTRA
jgi:hypothetical protein